MTPDVLGVLCRRHGVLALYLFGSRVEDGRRLLAGAPVTTGNSDLDVAVLFDDPATPLRRLAALQVALEDVFAPLRVDLMPLELVDPLLQFAAIDGLRIAALDTTRVDQFELDVMRQAAELLPIQRQRERDVFGVSTR